MEQLVAALVESRDHTDIRRVFDYHDGGTRGFEIAFQQLGISQSDWDYANKVAGFHSRIRVGRTSDGQVSQLQTQSTNTANQLASTQAQLTQTQLGTVQTQLTQLTASIVALQTAVAAIAPPQPTQPTS